MKFILILYIIVSAFYKEGVIKHWKIQNREKDFLHMKKQVCTSILRTDWYSIMNSMSINTHKPKSLLKDIEKHKTCLLKSNQ